MKETNDEHYFGTVGMAQDTLMLIKTDCHIRKECRDFKQMFDNLSQWDVMTWLKEECINPEW